MTAKPPKQNANSTLSGVLTSARVRPSAHGIAQVAASNVDRNQVTIRSLPPDAAQPSRFLDPNSPDDLTKIRRIDRALAGKLNGLGITHFDQIAQWTASDVRSLSAALRLGREIQRQGWIEQAAQFAIRRRQSKAPDVEPASATAQQSHVTQPESAQPTEPIPAATPPTAGAADPDIGTPLDRSGPEQQAADAGRNLVAKAAATIRSQHIFSKAIASIAAQAAKEAADAELGKAREDRDNTTVRGATLRPALNAVPVPDDETVKAKFAAAIASLAAGVPAVAAGFQKRSTPAPDLPALSEHVAPLLEAEMIPLAVPAFVECKTSAAKERPQAQTTEPTLPRSEPLETARSESETATPAVPDEPASSLPPPPSLETEPAAPVVPIATQASPATETPILPDDFGLIDDMPVHVAVRLYELGITQFAQIAAFDAADIAALAVDCDLGSRINREGWVEQAAALSKGFATRASIRRGNGELASVVAYPGKPLLGDSSLRRGLDARQVEVESAQATEPSPEIALDPPPPTPRPALVTIIAPAHRADEPAPPLSKVPTPTPPASAPHESTTTADAQFVDPQTDKPSKDPIAEVLVHEEAEVTITPRQASQTGQDTSLAMLRSVNDVDHAGPNASEVPSGSLQRKLAGSFAPSARDREDFAAYPGEVEEATVNIVRSSPKNQKPSDAPPAPVPTPREDTAASPQKEEESQNRFLKALQGR